MQPLLTVHSLATPAAVSGVRRALRDHGTDVQLCASELVTNVVRHVGEGVPVTVKVSGGGDRTRLEVTDLDPRALPDPREAVTGDDESGRGLALLDALVLRWGVARRPGGKTVWCEPTVRPSERTAAVAPCPGGEAVHTGADVSGVPFHDGHGHWVRSHGCGDR